jgi:hypothetical protein
VSGELGLNDVRLANQHDPEGRRQRRQGQDRPFDLGLRGVIAPHGVESDANHPQASSTSTIFLPR